MIVTHAMLLQAGMPPWDVNKFRDEWPNGAEINIDNLRRAREIGLSPTSLFYTIATKDVRQRYSAENQNAFRTADTAIKEAEAALELARKNRTQAETDARDAALVAGLIEAMTVQP